MTINVSTLDELSSQMKKLEAMRTYVKGIDLEATEKQIKKVSVDWPWGGSCVGYKELTDEVQKIVAERIKDLIGEAMNKQIGTVYRLKVKLTEEVNSIPVFKPL